MFDPERGGESIVTHPKSLSDAARVRIGAFATLVEAGDRVVDVARLLAWLATDRGAKCVLVEGGGVLNAAFFAARAVDEIYVTLVPRILGGKDAPTMVDGAGFAADAVPDLTLTSLEHIGDELFLRYDLAW
jgi:2,5-diamino-6-(ribosylamino)-4(3H)-pyrimidinone 5'-phosphate reductase